MDTNLREAWERGNEFRRGLPAVDVARHAREVILIASSSRGGSTIFAEMLRRSTVLMHFRAEINPQLRSFGCAGTEDDSVPGDHELPAGLGQALGADCGQPTDKLGTDQEVTAFAKEIAARLCLQWPEVDVSLSAVDESVRIVLAELRANEGWKDRFVDVSTFYANLLPRLQARWPGINPAAYDIDKQRLAAAVAPFTPVGPVEEPPFVLPVPWQHATVADLENRPLVIKTPSNVYRLAWLRRLFPNANVRVLHLTRNAAASINGLFDGWRFPGFHSHDVGGLSIQHYSEMAPGGDRWWKFDRPPGWEDQKRAPLEHVCAFQWTSAHQAVLRDNAPDRLTVRFEDIMGGAERQAQAVNELARWLNSPVEAELLHTLRRGLPIVMATAQPRHRRWFDRASLIEPVCKKPAVASVMSALGYPADPEKWE